MKTEIGLTEWLAELERLQADQPGGATVREISEHTGRSTEIVRLMLHQAKRDGRLEIVKAFRDTLAGYKQRLTTYRILPAPRKTGKR